MPSNHVCSKFGSPKSPHFLNQVPPRKQQLSLPDGLETHVEHGIAGVVVVTAIVVVARVVAIGGVVVVAAIVVVAGVVVIAALFVVAGVVVAAMICVVVAVVVAVPVNTYAFTGVREKLRTW